MNSISTYPFSAGDRVMVGIVTWQHPVAEIPEGPMASWPTPLPERYQTPAGPSGPICRYFVDGVVVANDREAGVLAVRMADTDRVDEYHFADFDGEEIVAFDETLPRTAAEAHARALRGEPTEPAVVCVCCGSPAEYRLTDPTDATVSPVGAPYCGPCTSSTAAGFAPIEVR
jgi:hypothetical protein